MGLHLVTAEHFDRFAALMRRNNAKRLDCGEYAKLDKNHTPLRSPRWRWVQFPGELQRHPTAVELVALGTSHLVAAVVSAARAHGLPVRASA